MLEEYPDYDQPIKQIAFFGVYLYVMRGDGSAQSRQGKDFELNFCTWLFSLISATAAYVCLFQFGFTAADASPACVYVSNFG